MLHDRRPRCGQPQIIFIQQRTAANCLECSDSVYGQIRCEQQNTKQAKAAYTDKCLSTIDTVK